MNKDGMRKEEEKAKLTEFEGENRMKESVVKESLTENERRGLNEDLGKESRKMNKDGMRKEEEKAKLTEFEGENRMKESVVKESLTENERRGLNEGLGKKMKEMNEEVVRKKDVKESLIKSEGGNGTMKEKEKENLSERDRKMFGEVSAEGNRRKSEEGMKKERLTERVMQSRGKEQGKENLNEKDRKMVGGDSRKETRRTSEEGMRNDEGKGRLIESDIASRGNKLVGKENLNEKDRKMVGGDSRKETRRTSEEGTRKGKEKLMEEGKNMVNTKVEGGNARTERNQMENSPETIRNELKNVTGMKTRRTSADSIRNEGERRRLKADDEEVIKRKENEGKSGLKESNREGSLIGEETNESKDVGRKTRRTSGEGVRLEKKLPDREGDEMKGPTSGVTMDCG
ncbi:uncharacterized protein LOC128251457 [Octopus bimaculoides]|nr:uncharacterized protein LOC128251457 [Octopus bimaculoides]